MATLNKIFFRGLVTLIPIAVTFYLLFWIVSVMEGLVGHILRLLMPDGFYIPGLGVIATLVLILIFGLVLNNFVMSELMERAERKLKSIPFFKAIYSPLRDLMNLFSKSGASGMKSVVLVEVAQGTKILGVVTREDFSDMPQSLREQSLVAVYCPWSYGMGGFTLLVPRTKIEPIDLPIEKAMSLAITGWVKVDSKITKEMENRQ
ncbi:MAG: hypothetical protein RJB66_416 [Pseudomonadota bacterium]|jgi:uncharacterized membrane protein